MLKKAKVKKIVAFKVTLFICEIWRCFYIFIILILFY